jgi:hypothetical protein
MSGTLQHGWLGAEDRARIRGQSIRSQSPGNLTLIHFQATFGHVAHTTLRLLGTEHGKIMQERSLRSDLKIPDRAVTLWVWARQYHQNRAPGCLFTKPPTHLPRPPALLPESPCHRGRQCWYQDQKKVAGLRCLCPAPAGTVAPPGASVETGGDRATDWTMSRLHWTISRQRPSD